MEKKLEIKHSGPVEEIIGTPPTRIIRWGTVIISLIILLLILFSWLIRFPTLVPGRALITTEKPPVNINARVTGRIDHLFVIDGAYVKAQTRLAVMETSASIESIDWLLGLIDTIPDRPETGVLSNLQVLLPDSPGLGEMQDSYSEYKLSLENYMNFIIVDSYGRRMESLSDEMESMSAYISELKRKEQLSRLNLELEHKRFLRDSGLFFQNVLTEVEYENAKQKYLKEEIELVQVALEGRDMEIKLASKHQQFQELYSLRQEEILRLRSDMSDRLTRLRADLDMWIKDYILISPIEGKVSFTEFWSENQVVNKDETVLTIVPPESGDIIARIYLPMNESGRVKAGQKVNIMLDGYPFIEYGMVSGVIKSKSLVPEEDEYVLEVNLPDGLTTFYGKNLEFSQRMSGNAEIITDNLRLIERLINPFKYIREKNKSLSDVQEV